jgi:Tfp pilus assembly protein PilV
MKDVMSMLKNEKGLSLAEVLGATVILGIVIIAFLNISGHMSLSFIRSDHNTEALRLAEETLTNKLNAIATANRIPDVGTQGVATTTIDGYEVTIYETELTNTTYDLPPGATQHVSVQAIVILKSTNPPPPLVSRLITVTVSWGG